MAPVWRRGGCQSVKHNNLRIAFINAGLWITLMLFSNIIGFVFGQKSMQQEAVLKGYAEWTADKNGKSIFSWKNCK